ncbi:glycosyltransferase family 2 protein [Sphingobacterium multivorum]|uniref:Chondroitin polymerase n=1 Tax=Sphingobacterium multivorum TaxID=28454 RepID=A0A2X2JMP1_SPHMU|nr:glycosyltransferase family 2 protein [Sphingobacterium multivorum]QRQ61295.1 glycosyltransferase family 2 protein [Sphingobacterium multivorum]SPZ88645.1 Chondroitin polymerase [Sphingobacterium multivorum]
MSLLTIVMPAYNAAKYINETLKSFIDQTFTDWKLIIINDASTDNTQQIVEEWKNKDSRIQLINNEINLRITKTMNKGIQFVESPFFARVDSDDILLPHHFEYLISYLNQNANVDICGSQVITIDGQGNFRRKWNYEIESDWIEQSAIFACPFLQSSVVMRTEVIKGLNGYREEMELIEDYELWIRSLKSYKAASLDLYTVKYRIHDHNISENNKSKMLLLLESMYHENQQNYPIDKTNLHLHARMEIGEWSNISLKLVKHLSKFENNLSAINSAQSFYSARQYKEVLRKYFANAYLKIATQNKGFVRFYAISLALIKYPKWVVFIINRKRENAKA